MRHNTKKINGFIRYVESSQEGTPYSDILNGWLGMTGERMDAEELKYYIGLIPMIHKRKRLKNHTADAAVQG